MAHRLQRSCLAVSIFSVLCTVPVWAHDGAIRHRLERGQTLAKVAKTYGIPLDLMLQANSELVPEHIPAGAQITIPEPPQGWAIYKAQAGDTMSSLGQRYGFPWAECVRLNPGCDPTHLSPGQDLRLPRASLEAGEPPVDLPFASDDVPAPSSAAGVATTARPAGTAPPPANAPVRVATAAPTLPPAELPRPDTGQWVEVRLADGARAWAPRATLLTYSKVPLPVEQVISVAQRFRGTVYAWGGQTPNGVDCSGYIQQVFSMAGYRVPRMADDQFAATQPVTQEDAQPGDLVFFTTYLPGPSHVGIYLGSGRFVHASSSRGVIETGLDDPYFAPRFLGTRRIKDWVAVKSETPPVSQQETP